MYGGFAADFAIMHLKVRNRKIASLQKFVVCETRGEFLEGVAVAGELAPPSTYSPHVLSPFS